MFLKYNSINNIKIGPFVDKTDGVTEETALSPVVNLSKNGGTIAPRNSSTTITHDANGIYNAELDATDCNTLGRLNLYVNDSATHLPYFSNYEVLPIKIYNSLVDGTDNIEVDIVSVNNTATTSVDDFKAASINLLPIASSAVSSVLVSTNVEIYKDEAIDIVFTITDENGNDVDLSSGTVNLNVYNLYDILKFNKSTTSGQITISGTNNNIATVSILTTDTNITADNYKYDLWLDDLLVSNGSFILNPSHKATS